MSLLKLVNIGKNYSGNQVLQGIHLEIEEGEIHGLVGENGAGKSTMMNILFGMPSIQSTGGYEGEMILDGEIYDPKNPIDAMEHGIGMVHQEFMLIPGFSVTENIKLNRENTKRNIFSRIFGEKLEGLDQKAMKKDAKEAIEQLDLQLEVDQKVEGMPVGYLQFIEIAREIDKSNLKLLILDEPTAVLTESEAEQFLVIIERLREMGIAILFINHRLDEIKRVCDRITVIRDGELIETVEAQDISSSEIAALMVGRELEISNSRMRNVADLPVTLEIRDLKVNMPGEVVRGIDLDVYKGEILGIGGLAGQGKLGIANGIFGLYPSTGEIIKDGEPLTLNSPKEMLDHEIVFLSEDRKDVGLLLDEPIDFNIAYTTLRNKERFLRKVGPLSFLNHKEIREHGEEMIESLDIRCRGPHQNTRFLSGGNQQKVCIARALTYEPEILLISEPTRGIDIGAKELVLETLRKLNEEKNMTIIITSSELAELKQIADRIAIITEGKVQAVFPADASDEAFGLAMSGESVEEVI